MKKLIAIVSTAVFASLVVLSFSSQPNNSAQLAGRAIFLDQASAKLMAGRAIFLDSYPVKSLADKSSALS
ncbi:hypothetical protein P9D34_17310 [Bacillus swezeyi]|uniref:Uncharacterized protein n=1 Tax=Bacillus swezeyi TaxID=1925020 RepID=A0A1R1RSP5_9BACI|nr:hypothetical protein [Bacillus swezeyi]MEC1262139.1 hypothetical protein [Bacillus swezeyi]MED1739493.1 hypothetical protein [Bacillus swezeyi]MED2927293.1 hypothetical protein [Bacillus swezeyi]MED2941546.1 hypothetical protein [Bacillus swezeyi]MED2962491.1 hypothetical protein [Bacillus swezeyi]